MERDQERFYENELEPREENAVAEQETDEVDDLKFFLELLKLIRMAINAGANVPLTNKKIIDADKCLRIIDDMEKNLPDAVQYGMKMYNERERVMSNAETTAMNRVTSAEMHANAVREKAKEEVSQRLADAENRAHDIIADAQERADHMLDESEIVRRAREEARIIKNDARIEANELRIKASQDAYKVLSAVEASCPSPSTPSAAAAPNWVRKANKRARPRRKTAPPRTVLSMGGVWRFGSHGSSGGIPRGRRVAAFGGSASAANPRRKARPSSCLPRRGAPRAYSLMMTATSKRSVSPMFSTEWPWPGNVAMESPGWTHTSTSSSMTRPSPSRKRNISVSFSCT